MTVRRTERGRPMQPLSLLVLFTLCGPLAAADLAVESPTITTAPAASPELRSGNVRVSQSTDARASPTVARPVTTTPLSDGLDLIEKVMKIGAYLVGAAWVYFNYFKGRIYEARLEVGIAGEILPVSSKKLARLTTRTKNVGLAKIEILESGSGVRVEGYDVATEEWTHIGTYSIYGDEELWVEPAETLEDQLLVALGTTDFVAYRAQIFVNYGATTWEASTIFSNRGPTDDEPITTLA
jgi:hypothetical protein